MRTIELGMKQNRMGPHLFHKLTIVIKRCPYLKYYHVFGVVTIDGVWVGELDLLIICTHHPELQVNYSAIADLHTLQITTR
jgi:hypothetical protein